MFNIHKMSLGSNIRRHRAALNLTLEKLSELTGDDVDVGTISALEVRGSKRSQYAASIAKAMSITVEQLLDDEFSILVGSHERRPTISAPPSPPTDPAALLHALAAHLNKVDPAQRVALGALLNAWAIGGGNPSMTPVIAEMVAPPQAPAQETPRRAA